MKNYMFLLIGLMGFILTEPVISQSISSEQEEQSLKSFRYTMTHKDWESLVISAKGKISSPLTVKIKTDTAKLKKVKKIAIISFNVYDWSKSDKSINEFYDTFKQAFEKHGFSVLPVEEVVSNSAYQNLNIEQNFAKKMFNLSSKYIDGFSQAYSLKPVYAGMFVDGVYKNSYANLENLKKLAQALNVDAVLCVELNYTIKYNLFGKGKIIFSRGQNMEGLKLDMFSGSEPYEIWSAALIENVKLKTDVRQSVGKKGFAPYIKKYLEKYGELAAINLLCKSK